MAASACGSLGLSTPAPRSPRLRPFWAALAAGGLLTVPFLALLPAGYAWLWERGLLLYWLAAAALCSIVAALVWRRWQRRTATAPQPIEPRPDPTWSPRDQAAFAEVEAIADGVEGTILTDSEALLALARQLVESVARHYHGEGEQAVLAFTLPEALLLSERVSRDLRRLIIENVPASHVLKLGHLVRGYGWRGYIGHAQRLYAAYRAVRPIVNPLQALLLEIRGHLTGEILSALTEATTTRIARLIALEIGRGAIDLYSGRLRLSEAELAGFQSAAAKRDQRATAAAVPEPLRLLLAGQVSVGKSALVNALSGEIRAAVDVLPATRAFTPYAIRAEGLPAAVLLDGPGLAGDESIVAALIRETAECDLILWVLAANRPARDIDVRTLAALRDHFATRPERRPPPVLAVLTHIDRLRPFAEWAPPYDLRSDTPKAQAIRAAIEAVGEDLGLAAEDIVPVCLDEKVGRYNVDAVWARVAALLPQARAAQLHRLLAEAGKTRDWRLVWSQALGAGRVLVKLWRE